MSGFKPNKSKQEESIPRPIGKIKKFDQKLSDIFDSPARIRIKEVLGDAVIDNPDPKGADMIITHPGTRFKYLELQVCASWMTPKFPFDKLYVFSRKLRYGPDVLFLTMDRLLRRGYLFNFDKKDLKHLRKRRLKKWSREWVYELPWWMCIECTIDDLDIDTLELL